MGLITLPGPLPVLWRRVVGVLALRVRSILVVVELRVLDDLLAAGVRARVAQRVVPGMPAIDGLIAHLLTRADVMARVPEVTGVGLAPRPATRVAGGGGRRDGPWLWAVRALGALGEDQHRM